MLIAIVAGTALAALTPGRTSSDDAPSVLRLYDISASTAVSATQQGSAIPPVHSWLEDMGAITAIERSPDYCLEILRSRQPEEWEGAERALDLREDGRLAVLAPPALQESVRSTLEFFAGTFGRESRLVIDVMTLK